MAEIVAIPDAERYVGEALRAASLTVGSRVYSSVPKTPTFPLITVQRITGRTVFKYAVDEANIQVTVWGETKSQAYDVAAEARVALISMEGTNPTGARIGGVTDSLSMSWQPDPVTARDRYVFGVNVVIRAD